MERLEHGPRDLTTVAPGLFRHAKLPCGSLSKLGRCKWIRIRSDSISQASLGHYESNFIVSPDPCKKKFTMLQAFSPRKVSRSGITILRLERAQSLGLVPSTAAVR